MTIVPGEDAAAAARARAVRRGFERHATDTPARRGLERDISELLQKLDALERGPHTGSPAERDARAAEQVTVAEQLTATIGALRALASRQRRSA